jgi:hypothetical protein
MAEQELDDSKSFFGRLKKLFSTNAIVTVDKDGKRRVVDTDEKQMSTNFVNLRDRYTKLQRSYYETNQGAQSMAYHQVRRELFRDYDAMDNDPIIASALDIYADESTTKNEFGDVLAIEGEVQRGIRFAVLAIAIGELGNKVGFITSFRPCLTQIHGNGTRASTDL